MVGAGTTGNALLEHTETYLSRILGELEVKIWKYSRDYIGITPKP